MGSNENFKYALFQDPQKKKIFVKETSRVKPVLVDLLANLRKVQKVKQGTCNFYPNDTDVYSPNSRNVFYLKTTGLPTLAWLFFGIFFLTLLSSFGFLIAIENYKNRFPTTDDNSYKSARNFVLFVFGISVFFISLFFYDKWNIEFKGLSEPKRNKFWYILSIIFVIFTGLCLCTISGVLSEKSSEILPLFTINVIILFSVLTVFLLFFRFRKHLVPPLILKILIMFVILIMILCCIIFGVNLSTEI